MSADSLGRSQGSQRGNEDPNAFPDFPRLLLSLPLLLSQVSLPALTTHPTSPYQLLRQPRSFSILIMTAELAPSSLRPLRCRWSDLSEEERDRRLAALDLVINAPEPVLICRPCGYALQPSVDCVTRHLSDKHAVPKHLRDGLFFLVRSLCLPDPNTLPLRPQFYGTKSFVELSESTCRHWPRLGGAQAHIR
jgi:hypothetical protein